jgi:hypothetical protein
MKHYIAFWSSEGFESITDITEYDPEHWNLDNAQRVLQGDNTLPNPVNHMLMTMTLRARYNSQRFYEIYSFSADDDLDQETLNIWSADNPQGAAEWIRNNGNRIYSDRVKKDRVLIT